MFIKYKLNMSAEVSNELDEAFWRYWNVGITVFRP